MRETGRAIGHRILTTPSVLVALLLALQMAGCQDRSSNTSSSGSATSSTSYCGTQAANSYCVSAANGNDSNSGSTSAPFKTIAHALTVATSGHTVQVAPGQYDTASGETFPLYVPAGVTLSGDVTHKGLGTTTTTITGMGVVSGITDPTGPYTIDAAIVPSTGSTIEGLDIVAATGPDEATLIAFINTGVTLKDNTLNGNSTAYVDVMDVSTGGNTFTGNEITKANLAAYYSVTSSTTYPAADVFSNNVFSHSSNGFYVYEGQSGASTGGSFDLGGGGGSTGGNTFCGWTSAGLYLVIGGAATVYASGNSWSVASPTPVHYTSGVTGDIVYQTSSPTFSMTSTLPVATPCP
jgi:Protein of unknown function (DUF1565)